MGENPSCERCATCKFWHPIGPKLGQCRAVPPAWHIDSIFSYPITHQSSDCIHIEKEAERPIPAPAYRLAAGAE